MGRAEQPRTALVITVLQNDFLSPGGAAWGLLQDSLADLLREYRLDPELKPGQPGVWVNGRKIASIGVAAHEAGHALQDAGGYAKAMDESFYRRQRELMAGVLAEQHAVITTAAVPGKRAPILITREMAARMAPGSVIVA